MTAKIGTIALRMLVTADDTCFEANGNMLKGRAIQRMNSSAIFPRAARGTGRRAAAKRDSVANPMIIRKKIDSIGVRPHEDLLG